MQPSDLHKTPDRLDHGIEDLYWENGKLFATHPMENSNRHKWTSPLPGYSLSDMAMQSTEKDHSMKLMNDEEEEKIEKATAFATGDDLIDYLDNLDSREPVGMPTSKPITSLPSSQSYLLSSEINRVDPSSQHLPTLSGDLADFATLCGPASLGGHLSVSARGRPVPSLPFSIPQDEIGKLSDAVLNRISAQCMGSSSLQPLETTLLNQNAGDSMILNVHRVAPIGNLLSSSNVSSLSSIDISPSSDLDSVLLDSSGSGFSAGNGGKSNEGAGVKKARAVDDLDSDSEGFFDEIVAPRKPRQEQGPSTKRMRAAEIHNEAERKRRGKINEKLKALQELIPNANKTDKASVLTEAIDYLKKLRLQLQLMCCRNGLVISPVVVSQGAQNPQMQQAGADLNIDREIEATQRASGGLVDLQQFPLTSMAAREFSVQTGVPPFNEASFAATEALVSSSKGLGHEFNTNSAQQVSFSQPYQGITQ